MRRQGQWVSSADVYEEKKVLSAAAIQVARSELRETENSRKQALDAFRRWIKQNPKIANCRLDSSFLLRFLRAKKMSLPMAQETLERYLLLRLSTQTWNFQNLDCFSKDLDDLITAGYIFPSPMRDAFGRRVIITVPGKFDPQKHRNEDMLRLHALAYETIVENEEDQVNGLVHFVDCEGVSFSYLTLFTPREAVRIAKNAERTLPMRHKMIIGFNINPALKFVVDWGMTLISQKMRDRVKVLTNVEDTHSLIDKNVLPKEYGGQTPKAEMIRLWKLELQEQRAKLLSNDFMKVHLHMFSDKEQQGAVSALSKNVCVPTEAALVYGVNGSFRKLEVD